MHYMHSRFSSLISNRMKRVVAFGVTAFLLFSLNAQNALAELVLFDADTYPATKLSHFTQPWTKGSDIVPVAATVEKVGGKMIEITYKGKEGRGTTRVQLSSDETKSLQGMRPGGIKLLIDYDREDFSKLCVISCFSDGSAVNSNVMLEKGLKEYPITSGWPTGKAKIPLQWGLLSKIYIESALPDLKWRLKKVVAMEAEAKSSASVALVFDKARKVHEILPVNPKVKIDGMLDEWNAVKPLSSYYYYGAGTEVVLADSPMKVKLCYDDENLYVASSSDFPTPPVALKTKPDDNIWEDEALELFFSSELDNNCFIQFVVNQRGTVFDYIREFDKVAAMIVTKKEWTLNHTKAFACESGVWNAEMAFPLSELSFDRKANNILAFQIAQDYAERPEKRLKTVAWTPSKSLPTPGSFGILVFNQKPFGKGDVSVESIAKNAADGVDVTINCAFNSFVQGEYTVTTTIVSPDLSATASQQLTLTGEKAIKSFVVRDGIKNKDSSYTLYVSIRNNNGNARVMAVNFNNAVVAADLFGKKQFFPEPKRVQWNAGEFFAGDATTLYLEDDATPRTVRTAEIFVKKYFGYVGRKLVIKKGAPFDIGGILFKIAKTAQYSGKDEPLKKEGYLLSVSKDRVTLVGGDEPGLYYAGVTFFQLLRNTMKIRDRHPVACADIFDWPDIQNRSILFNGQWPFAGNEIKEYATGDDLIEWTDRYVAGTKMNLLFLNVWGNMKFKRRPEFNTNPRASFTLDDMARLADFCRDNFIEPVPFIQGGSHCDGWLLQFHPELREKGFRVQADVTHPNHDSIVYDCFQDIIEAMKPKYFSPIGDEWWQDGKPGEKADELLGGKSRNRVFLEWHVKLNNWLKDKGIKMILAHDMLTPFHNGKVFDTYKIADEFPKDVIVIAWIHPSMVRPQFFYDRGFALWVSATDNALWDTERKKINSCGLGLYDGWFGTRCLMARSYARTGRIVTYPRLIRFVDWAWNFRTEKPDTVEDWISMGKTPAGIQLFAVTPNPAAGEKIECIDMAKYANAAINEYAAANKIFSPDGAIVITDGIFDCGNIPMKFSAGGKNDCISVKKGGPGVSIEIGKAYASLIFLHTMHYTDEMVKGLPVQMYRQWQRGFPAGMYVVKYADGSSITVPLRIDRNIGLNDDVANAMNPHDCRYLLRLENINGAPFNLHQYEWVNPKPDVAITSVAMLHDNIFDFNVFLFALSGRTSVLGNGAADGTANSAGSNMKDENQVKQAVFKTSSFFGAPDNSKTLERIDAEDAPYNGKHAWDEYRKLLAELAKPKYRVLPLGEFNKDSSTDKVLVALRHDSDSHPLKALKMAEIEKAMGIRSTYYLLHSAKYYGTVKEGVVIRNGAVDELAKKLWGTGFEIGIHRDLFNMMWKYQFEPRAFMKEEVAYYKTLGIPVTGSAAHGDGTTIGRKLNEMWIYSEFGKKGAYVLNGTSYPYGEYKTVDFGVDYEAYLLKYTSNIADIDGKSPDEMIKFLNTLNPGTRCGLLIHPEHWGKPVK